MKLYIFAPFSGCEQNRFAYIIRLKQLIKSQQIHNSLRPRTDLSFLKQSRNYGPFVVHRIIPQ